MTELNEDLLRDLARLASRYSTDDWETLLSYVRDPQRREAVTTLLEQLAGASRVRRSSRGASGSQGQPQSVARSLDELQKQDPERALILETLWRGLRERRVLREMSSLRNFAGIVGLKELRSAKREQAVNQLMRHLLLVDIESLQTAVRQVSDGDRNLDEEYQRWVQLILNEHSDDIG